MGTQIIFIVLAAVILLFATLCVTTARVMRAATYLIFVLFGVAGIYFMLGYSYLGAAQIAVYAGGITILYIFAIQLVSKQALQGLKERLAVSKLLRGLFVALLGAFTVGLITLKFSPLGDDRTARALGESLSGSAEVNMEEIGTSLLGSGMHQYILPFEFISLFLLACIIGGVMIARKEEQK